MRDSKPVLLVEDDDIDAMTVARAFKDLKLNNPLVRVINGEEAMARLKDAASERPCLILLDLNMPRMNGTELLQLLKADKLLRRIPAVVLTTSEEHTDVRDTYRCSAAGYVVKPVDYKRFVEAVRRIGLYWTLSELPPEEGG